MVATPIDLSRIINIRKPHTRVSYELQEMGKPDLEDIVLEFARAHKLPRGSQNDTRQGVTGTRHGASAVKEKR